MSNDIKLPDNPGARRWLQINWRITDAFGAIEKEGSLKLYTSRWAFGEPYLLLEVIMELGRNPKEFLSNRSRLNITWSTLPVPHPLSTTEEGFKDWFKKQSADEEVQ
jgi:hypothetical protein